MKVDAFNLAKQKQEDAYYVFPFSFSEKVLWRSLKENSNGPISTQSGPLASDRWKAAVINVSLTHWSVLNIFV